MVNADPVAQEALELLAVRRVEAGVGHRDAQRLLVGLRRDVDAHQVLRLFGGAPLREVDQVDRRAVDRDQVGDRLVQRRLAVVELQRHRALAPAHHRHLALGQRREPVGDDVHVAQRGRHQEERRLRQAEQRDLPGHPALAIGVVVKLVHHDVVGAPGAVAQRHVGQDLGGAADDRRVAVDAGVAGQHPDPLGPEQPAEIEELLVDQRLDRRGVERRLSLGEALEVERRRHQRLARARRRVEHDVLALHELEQRLLLRRIERQSRGGHVGDEPRQELVGAGVGAREERRQRRQRGGW